MPTKKLPHRPLLRWFGGKWLIAPWIISHFPPHKTYVEPFGGAASILVRKPRSKVEVLNDLDNRLVALYRCVRDPTLHLMLAAALDATLFSLAEFELSFLPVDRAGHTESEYLVEVARRLIVRGAMGFATGKEDASQTGFRDYTGAHRRGAPVHDWDGVADSIAAMHVRFKGVIIDSRDAVAVIQRHDSLATLHYVDPPYVGYVRSERCGYRHELDTAGHNRLLDALLGVKGMVVLSGYTNMLYAERLHGWRSVMQRSMTTGGWNYEVLWLNPAAAAALDASKRQLSLFDAYGPLLPADSGCVQQEEAAHVPQNAQAAVRADRDSRRADRLAVRRRQAGAGAPGVRSPE
jgi:DNA adenine methylase